MGSIVVVEDKQIRRQEEAEAIDKDREALRRYLTSRGCPRKQIGLFMDMAAQTCVESNGEPCDRCSDESQGKSEREGCSGGSEDEVEDQQVGDEIRILVVWTTINLREHYVVR